MRYQVLKVVKAIGVAASVVLASTASLADDAQILMMSTPAGEHTSLSRLVTDKKGKIYLSWVRSSEDRTQLYQAKLDGDQWLEGGLITQGDDWFVNWADFPSLVVNDSSMAAHWLQMSGEGTFDYDVKAAFYDKYTQVWGEPITIHKDGVKAEHGFVSMLSMNGNRTFITWLDGRNTSSGMTLRAGIFDSDGKTLRDWELDGLTCECCQTSAAISANGPIVVYRDRSEKEVRDIYITRLVADKWTTPTAVFADNWVVNGCPVNGPAVAARDNMAAVIWFSAKDDQPMVKLAISHTAGKSFSKPVIVAKSSTNGRVGITLLDTGNIAVSWLATHGSQAQLKMALYSPQGELLDTVRIADTSASRRSGFPVITSSGNDVYVTWTEISRHEQAQEQAAKVKLARVRF